MGFKITVITIEVITMDRRKRKTRKAIFDACVSLTKEVDFQQITVNEIVKTADINRGTFYLHFEDKFDMMNSFENEMIEKIENVLVKNLPDEQSNQQFLESRYTTIIEILNCYTNNKELLQLLLRSSNNTSFQLKLREKLKVVMTEQVLPKISKSELNVPIDLFVILFTSASLSLAEYAYKTDTAINSEELANFLIKLMMQGPAKTLGLISNE